MGEEKNVYSSPHWAFIFQSIQEHGHLPRSRRKDAGSLSNAVSHTASFPNSQYFFLASVSFCGIACCCRCYVASVVSNSVWPHRRQPTRILRPYTLTICERTATWNLGACFQWKELKKQILRFITPSSQEEATCPKLNQIHSWDSELQCRTGGWVGSTHSPAAVPTCSCPTTFLTAAAFLLPTLLSRVLLKAAIPWAFDIKPVHFTWLNLSISSFISCNQPPPPTHTQM